VPAVAGRHRRLEARRSRPPAGRRLEGRFWAPTTVSGGRRSTTLLGETAVRSCAGEKEEDSQMNAGRAAAAAATVAPRGADALRVPGLSKTFGATPALQEVGIDIRAGEIHALVGQNGPGKSTLIKALAGYHQPDHGADAVLTDLAVTAGPGPGPAAPRLRSPTSVIQPRRMKCRKGSHGDDIDRDAGAGVRGRRGGRSYQRAVGGGW
jgi:hypothetical protein